MERLRITEQGRLWLDDLFLFEKEALKLDLCETPHRAMCGIIQEQEINREKPNSMLVVPRGFYKTSIACGAAVWKQLRQLFLYDNPYHRIVLCSATLPLSEASLRAIENILRDNPALQEHYGELWVYDSKKHISSRKKDGLTLAPRLRAGELASIREPSFWVGSERRISTGFHADEAIVDDLNNDKNSDTALQREKIHRYWELLRPILGAKDRSGNPVRTHVSATPWHDDDVRGRILRNDSDKQETTPEYQSTWNVLQHSAYNEDGTAWWPEGCSLEFLESLKETMSYSQFAANYLCDPVGQKGFVDEDRLVWRSRDTFPKAGDIRDFRATVDPNMHFEARAIGCYAAIAVSGYDKFSTLFFYDARGSREWGTAQLIDALFQLREDWLAYHQNLPILIEDIHMAHFAHAIALEEARRSDETGERIHLNIKWVNTQTESKYTKWSKMKPRFENARVVLAEEIAPKIKVEIKEELVRGEAARFYDFLDAMSMAYVGVKPRIVKDEKGRPVMLPKVERPTGPISGPTLADIYPDLRRIYS